MTRGFLLGKFMPLHCGHESMINFARSYCDHLTIYLGSRSDEPIKGEIRHFWLRTMFPGCNIIWRNNDTLPQAPGPEYPNFQETWINEVKMTLIPGEKYDFVFASEDYGKWLAEGVGARFVPVDPSRNAVPISATRIRNDPYGNWEYIPEVVRSYYAKKVCLFGPESTGKSSLIRELARDYNTPYVPEYGRTYTEMFGTDLDFTDMVNIITGHQALTKALLPKANRVLFCDTDPILSLVWCDMLGIRRPSLGLLHKPCDFYLLMGTDLPWKDDGTRYFDDAERRKKFFELCKAELDNRGLPYRLVLGTGQQRVINAFDHVTEFLGF